MVVRLRIHVFVALLPGVLAGAHAADNARFAGAGCEADSKAWAQDSDEVSMIQKYHAATFKRDGGARASVLAPTKSPMPAPIFSDVQRSPGEAGVPSWRRRPLLVLCAAALALLVLQGLASTSAVFGASSSLAAEAAVKSAAADADRPLPPGVFVATMACAFMSEASCTAAMPTAHLCAGGLLSSVCFWLLGRLASAPLFWHIEKRGLAQVALAVHCVAMASGQVLYGMCAAKLLLSPSAAAPRAAVVTTVPLALLHVLLMAGRVAVGFASGANFSASSAVVADAGTRRRTEYLCYWAFAGGLGALAGPGLGSFSLTGAKTELEMLLPGAFLSGASLLLLYSLPLLIDTKASALAPPMAASSEAELSPSKKRQAAGAITLNVLMQVTRQATCLLWEAGTAAVLVTQFGLDDWDARTSALGIVAASLVALAIGARFVVGSDERVLLMLSSSVAAFGCCLRFRFSTAADGAGIFALAALAGYTGPFLSLAPMIAFAAKAVCSDASCAESLSGLAAWHRVLMGHHLVSSAGVATALAALWSPGSGTAPQPPGFVGFVMHFAVLMLIAIQVVPQMSGPWRSSAKFRGAQAQQRT